MMARGKQPQPHGARGHVRAAKHHQGIQPLFSISTDPAVAAPHLGSVVPSHPHEAPQLGIIQQGIIIIPRSSKVERVAENFAIEDFKLTDAEMKAMSGLKKPDGRLVNNPKWAPKWDL